MSPFSYRHLYYFWVVATEGGISRAATRLGMAVQTVSAQVRELERSLGCALLQPSGRGVVLTDAGTAAFRQADQIFQLGEQLPEIVREAGRPSSVRLAVGISQGLPKLVVRSLLQPALDAASVRIVCQEGEFDTLLADLALHRLDVLLTDRPPAANATIRVYSHLLGASEIAWYAPKRWLKAGRDFPRSLAKTPVLLPSKRGAVRPLLDRWFEHHGLRPNIVGEFDDSALLKTFASGGMGVFPAAVRVEQDLAGRYDARPIGRCAGVEERFFAVGTERKITHPLVRLLVPRPASAGA